MRRVIDHDLITLVVRVVVGVTFIYASYYKIVDPASFARSIWYYHMVPGTLINLMALFLPWLELVCGVCLILGFCFRGAIVLVNLMVLVFLIALSTAVARGINIDCGCFKAAQASSESAWEAIWFDLVLVVLSFQLLFSRSRRWMLMRA